MSQASTALTSQDYFLSNTSMVQLAVKQYVALKGKEIVNVDDLEEFEDDAIDNVVQNLRRPQDILHPTVQAHTGSAEIVADLAAVSPVPFQAAVAQHNRVDA